MSLELWPKVGNGTRQDQLRHRVRNDNWSPRMAHAGDAEKLAASAQPSNPTDRPLRFERSPMLGESHRGKSRGQLTREKTALDQTFDFIHTSPFQDVVATQITVI